MRKRKVGEEMAALREQRWTTRDARRVLTVFRRSGLSLAAFAREHGLTAQRLSWWRKRLGEWGAGESDGNASTVRFVPAVVPEPAASAGGQVAVRLPGGVLVEITQASAQWVASLVRGLCEASS